MFRESVEKTESLTSCSLKNITKPSGILIFREVVFLIGAVARLIDVQGIRSL